MYFRYVLVQVQNREIAYLRIGGYSDNSKRVVIVGLQHAREWLAASMTMASAAFQKQSARHVVRC